MVIAFKVYFSSLEEDAEGSDVFNDFIPKYLHVEKFRMGDIFALHSS